MDTIEKVLYSYKELKRASKRLRRKACTINDGIKSNYKAADVIPGRISAVYYEGSRQEDEVIKNNELIIKADQADKLREIIENDVESLIDEDPELGEEMCDVIKMKYFFKFKNAKIEIKLSISDSTLYRRRKKALEVLKKNGLQHLYGKIRNIV